MENQAIVFTLLLEKNIVYGELWVATDEKASLTRCWSPSFATDFRPEVHREPRGKIKSLSPAERPVGFEPQNFWLCYNALIPLSYSPLSLKDLARGF